MSPDSEGLGAAVEAGVGSNLTQPSGILYFVLYSLKPAQERVRFGKQTDRARQDSNG